MFPGSLGSLRCLLALLCFVAPLRASEPVIAYGVTNVPIGQAVINNDPYYGTYYVTELGSDGLDGVSVFLGEPDSGASFSLNASYLNDGNFMIAKSYGRLNGTEDSLLATIQGGRASPQVYPLAIDYSPLAPQSVTYQIFYQGTLQREFTRGTPMVVIDYGYGTYPSVNPLYRRSDGALGTDLRLTQAVTFTFPEVLGSAVGDQLFIRLNNPANVPGNASRVDFFGGGQLYDFTFNAIALGVFGRPHRSVLGATLQARPNWLHIGNLVTSNDPPGVLIELERLGALNLQLVPFDLTASNASLFVSAVGVVAGETYRPLGAFQIYHETNRLAIGLEQSESTEMQAIVLTNGAIVKIATLSAAAIVRVPTNVAIGSITAHAKTVEQLPGFHVQFTQSVPITIPGESPVSGDELRLVLPSPARMEHLVNLYFAARNVDSLTITNELATSPAGPPRLEIARVPDVAHMPASVEIKWPDPNRLMALAYTREGPDGPYYDVVTDPVTFIDPYRFVTIPVVRTNKVTFYKLFYQPSD